jgi:hypothetical protein
MSLAGGAGRAMIVRPAAAAAWPAAGVFMPFFELKPKRVTVRWIWLVWTALSGAGALLGMIVAVDGYPLESFGRRPVPDIGPETAIFAGMMALGLAFGQWWILRYLTDAIGRAMVIVWLWLPITWLGAAAMVLPLWVFHPADAPLLAAWLIAILPGSGVLGILQALILRRSVPVSFRWTVLTMLGAALGSIFGTGLAIAVGPMGPLPETLWFTGVGLGIGAFQGPGLGRALTGLAEEDAWSA